jgi:hypothetical protein
MGSVPKMARISTHGNHNIPICSIVHLKFSRRSSNSLDPIGAPLASFDWFAETFATSLMIVACHQSHSILPLT